MAQVAPKSPTPQQPASLTITPTTLPEVLQVLDNTGTWVPMGLVNSTKHTFTAIGGEADIVVTDPEIGMAANNGQDNSPFVDALMTHQMPAAWGGYDVLFPGIPGQTTTTYYFTEPLVNRRTATYHCAGSVGYLATILAFAPGVDGFTQEIYTYTSDGGIGGGILSSCYVVSTGSGGATADTANPTKLTGVGFTYVPNAPRPSWHVGDGLILTGGSNGVSAIATSFPVPMGTTITAVDPSTGDLTLSNPVTQSLGQYWSWIPKATSLFTQTGINNFSNGDTIEVGPNTYTMVTTLSTVHTVLIGKDFAASANNLVAAVNGWNGQQVTYMPSTYGNDAFAGNLLVNASYTSGVITFASNYGSPDANFYPSVYTPAGTAAGAFGAATFSGAPTSVQQGMATFQLPGPNTPGGGQEFKVVTQPTAGIFYGYIVGNNLTITSMYSGSVVAGQPMGTNGGVSPATIIMSGSGTSWIVNNSQTVGSAASPVAMYAGGLIVAITSGPRLLRGGDVIWGDAFRFGTTAAVYGGTVGAQTFQMLPAAALGATDPPLVAHPPGSEGNMWIIPAGLKRRAPANAEHNMFVGWGIGLSMACTSDSATGTSNCDLSRDEANGHDGNFVGRWVAGDNTATATSKNEQFSGNFLMDVWEGGSLGEIYYNLNNESPEAATAKWGFIKNCVNDNWTTIFGGYIGGGNGCGDGEYSIPTTYGGPVFYGDVGFSGPSGGLSQLNRAFTNGLNFYGGPDGTQCVTLSGDATAWSAIMFSSNGCGIGANLAMRWNAGGNYWAWNQQYPGNEVMVFSNGGDYFAKGGVVFPSQVSIGYGHNTRSIYSGPDPQAGTGSPSIPGDIQINTAPHAGGNAFWQLTPTFTTTATVDFTGGSPNPLPVAACPPNPFPYIETKVIDTTPTVPVVLGLYASCTGTSLSFFIVAADAKAGDTIILANQLPAAKMPNDPNGANWPVASLTDVASLLTYAPCTGDAVIGLGVVYNGQDATAAGYNAPVSGASLGSTRRLVFCDGTSWTYH